MVAFFLDICVLQDLFSGRTKMIGRLDSSLYLIDESFTSTSNVHASNPIFNNNIWHLRLGHLSDFVLKHVIPLQDKLSSINSSSCGIYFKAK